MQRYLVIKVANLPSAVAAPRTREFRCPPNVQIRNLLYMPGPGGPTGLQEEAPPTPALASSGENEAVAALDLNETYEELSLETYSKNPCAEEIKELMRLFHRRLMNHLGVVKPETETTWDYEGAIKALQEAAAVAAGANGSQPLATSTEVAVPSENSRKTVETIRNEDQPTDLETTQSELADLLNIPNLLLPEGVGDPESGASGPPSAVKAIWKLVSGSNSSESNGENAGQGNKGQLAIGGPEDPKYQGSKFWFDFHLPAIYLLTRENVIMLKY